MPLLTWVSPDEVKPAPYPLLLVQAFVNTWDADDSTDLLAAPDSAHRWLLNAGLLHEHDLGRPLDLGKVMAVREALRRMLDANAGHRKLELDELQPLTAVTTRTSLRMAMDADGGLHLRPSDDGPIDTLAANFLLIVRDAQEDGTWVHLKSCSNPECRWAYYDRSHSRRGRWCDMATCGNRVKNRTLRARRR